MEICRGQGFEGAKFVRMRDGGRWRSAVSRLTSGFQMCVCFGPQEDFWIFPALLCERCR